MEHPPASISVVGGELVPVDRMEVVGTRGSWQLPKMGPVHGAGADLQWVTPTAQVVGMPSLEKAHDKVGMCKVWYQVHPG